jgi:hypothetical protein
MIPMSRRALPLLLLAAFLLPAVASAQIRMVQVDEIAGEITIQNFASADTVDVGGYFMCREPGTYQQLSALTILGGGDLDLSAGEEVTVVYAPTPAAGGVGLYIQSGFTNPDNLADYVQYKNVAGFRENVADDAGLWVPGTFATGDPGPYFYSGNGVSDNGATFWTNVAPTPPTVPALSPWAIAMLVGALIVVGTATRPRA